MKLEKNKFTDEELREIQDSAKERTVRTQTVEYGMETLINKIDDELIKLDPDYQRHHRWDDETSSRLIESLILNIPIPYIYISKDVDVDEEIEGKTRYTVIDGQQRLTAIHGFVKEKYALQGLKVLPKLENIKYSELPIFLKRRLEERTIKCLIIDSTLDRSVKYEIFERLNTGSLELSNQEIRNAIFRGPFNKQIKELAKLKIIKKMFYISPVKGEKYASREKAMDDVELILRFFAFSIDVGYKNYNGDLKEFLNNRMEMFNNLSEEKVSELGKSFLNILGLIEKQLESNWFSKYKASGSTLKITSKFNVSVYDAIAVAVSIEGTTQNLTRDNLDEIFKEQEFASSIEGSTMDVKKVCYRIDRIRRLLQNGK